MRDFFAPAGPPARFLFPRSVPLSHSWPTPQGGNLPIVTMELRLRLCAWDPYFIALANLIYYLVSKLGDPFAPLN
jgi:hypothetical protein